MINMAAVTEYVCDRYYRVIYKRDRYSEEQRVCGVLLNYNSGNIVLLSEKGIHHIMNNDILFMEPTKVPVDWITEEFKELLKSFGITGRN